MSFEMNSMPRKFDRRNFIKKTGLGSLGLAFTDWPQLSDTKYWDIVQERYPISKSPLTNLNSGSAGSQSLQTQKAVINYYKESNSYPFYERVTEWQDKKKSILDSLAEIINASSEEICITRNTTEGLKTIINGFPFRSGDNIIMSRSDYDSIKAFINAKAEKDGLTVSEVEVRPHEMSDEEILGVYQSATTDNTRLILLTHIEHRFGRLLPLKPIIDMAHSKNIEVMVDAAHSFGFWSHDVKELDIDYYASSLHKRFNGPYGTGILYIKKDKIADMRPLYPYIKPESSDINKFTYLGTHASFLEMGIASALEENLSIGLDRKLQRIQELTECIEKKVKKLGYCEILRHKSQANTGITSLSFKGKEKIKHHALLKYLKEYESIHVKTISFNEVQGIRISPNVYNNESEIERLVEGIKKFMEDKK